MDWRDLGQQFQSKSDWTGLTPKELRVALEGTIIAAAYANVPQSQHAECLAFHEDQTDFAMYAMVFTCFPFSDNPEWSLKEALRHVENQTFEKNSKRNCFVGYLNMYFYKYIHDVELHDLQMLLMLNEGLSLNDGIDFFITKMLYPRLIEANPGMLVTYHMLSDVPESRIQSLNQISREMQTAYQKNDQVALFKNIYFLMTNFAGTAYRAVHRAVLSLLAIDMDDFRNTFYEYLPEIIENEGAITIGDITD